MNDKSSLRSANLPIACLWCGLLLLSAGCGIEPQIPVAQGPDGIMSVGNVSSVGYYTGAMTPAPTPEQALLCVVEQRTFPPGGGSKLPASLIRVTDSTEASYPLIAIAARWTSRDAPVYKIVTGKPLPTPPPEGFSSPDGVENATITDGSTAASSAHSGLWKRLYRLEGKNLVPSGAGFFEFGNLDRVLLTVVPAKGADETQIEFADGPVTLNYMFLVPRAASDLKLRFGAEAPVALSVK